MNDINNSKVEIQITEEKGKFVYNITVDGRKYTRKSIRKFEYVLLVNIHTENKTFVSAYSSSLKNAESQANTWKHMAQTRIVKL